jgi:chitinase
MNAQSEIQVGAYYAGWMQGWYNNGRLPAENIDFSTVDYVIHFALVPHSDGSFDDQPNSVHESNSASLVNAVHAAGKKVIICVGGWDTADDFRGAVSSGNLTYFVTNLVTFMTTRGYDGIDIDWEPVESSDAALFTAFITTLRTALDLISPRPLLTIAAAWQPTVIAQVAQHIDQIHLMTYDMSGAWQGWVSWHNAPVYSGGFQFPCCPGKYVPSADEMVNNFLAAGIPSNKLNIGVDFYGYIWKGGSGTSTGGVTEPRQEWNSYPEVFPNKPYYQILDEYYRPDYYRYDSSAAASYLSIDNQCNWNDMFITFDDERTCKAKVDYAKKKVLPEFSFGSSGQESFQIQPNSPC